MVPDFLEAIQFAAAGKEIKKKSLAELAMDYGYVYVAQVAMGAKPAQTLKAITEARYSRLTREFPERAEELFERNEQAAMKRYEYLLRLKELHAAE